MLTGTNQLRAEEDSKNEAILKKSLEALLKLVKTHLDIFFEELFENYFALLTNLWRTALKRMLT